MSETRGRLFARFTYLWPMQGWLARGRTDEMEEEAAGIECSSLRGFDGKFVQANTN